jgi:hypothetical protein
MVFDATAIQDRTDGFYDMDQRVVGVFPAQIDGVLQRFFVGLRKIYGNGNAFLVVIPG